MNFWKVMWANSIEVVLKSSNYFKIPTFKMFGFQKVSSKVNNLKIWQRNFVNRNWKIWINIWVHRIKADHCFHVKFCQKSLSLNFCSNLNLTRMTKVMIGEIHWRKIMLTISFWTNRKFQVKFNNFKIWPKKKKMIM